MRREDKGLDEYLSLMKTEEINLLKLNRLARAIAERHPAIDPFRPSETLLVSLFEAVNIFYEFLAYAERRSLKATAPGYFKRLNEALEDPELRQWFDLVKEIARTADEKL